MAPHCTLGVLDGFGSVFACSDPDRILDRDYFMKRKPAPTKEEAEADLAGSVSALDGLHPRLKPGAEPVYRAARGRLDDGRRKLAQAKDQLGELAKEHAAYAVELERSAKDLNADRAFAAAIRRSGKVVIGWEALTPA